jgi:hypothetical protein
MDVTSARAVNGVTDGRDFPWLAGRNLYARLIRTDV